ncbi:MAG: undecaprenyldiphospho-muramoylpentapeptide beta-N-acetylglucosaminyltransferase [Holosporales bacterium]|jgi:UDP-N-acetylglucosamine--N-acetylmuramyl-(pentapeptide) pyrophosphoryl-undecaprenol N-acetylglucosamine transferase|nr:undecaprenyldiphospho-muramoylpentapeptide beta-N-acetylglucosaminyltransferase [Holosporales bacterium]
MKIIIAAGGTGGHVFPAVCVASELKKNNIAILFATDKRGAKYLGSFEKEAIIQNINTSSRLKLYFSLLINIVYAIFYLLKSKCDCVIGFGGYPSVPYVLAAQILRKKTLIHEQNAVIGKANKLLSLFASKIITSFENTKNLAKSQKVKNIGMPTRFENEYDSEENLKNKKFTILTFAGSQGARIFSKLITDALLSLEKDIVAYSQVLPEDKDFVECQYRKAQIEYKVSDFFHNIGDLYKQADLVISRSGASSVFEIIGFGKPSILIPYKKSINGDQEENAKFLLKRNAAFVIDEAEISSQKLKKIILEVINNPNQINSMKENLKKLYIPNITKKLSDEIISLINSKL